VSPLLLSGISDSASRRAVLSLLLVPSILAIVVGAIGKNRAALRAGEGRSLAIAGIVLGVIGGVL
jgi:hypothetical protein